MVITFWPNFDCVMLIHQLAEHAT